MQPTRTGAAELPTGTRNAGQALVDQLVACGAEYVFGNPGTTEYAVLDAIGQTEGIDFVLTLHEGAAVSAAIGYARASGKVGVVEVHAAPGLGNALGMIYDAMVGETPLLVYVGQVEQSAYYLEPLLSGDLVSLARPVTKWAYEVHTADEVPQVVRRAMKVALTPPYGPVLVSVPMDIAEQRCDAVVEPHRPLRTRTRPDPDAVIEAAEVILGATNPIVVTGDGIARSGAVDEVARLAHLIGAPLRGGFLFETAIDPDDRLGGERLNAGAAETNAVLRNHDVVVVAGSKLHKQLFPIAGDQAAGARVVHISADPWELGKNQSGTLVWGDERLALTDLVDAIEERVTAGHLRAWDKRCLAVKDELRAAAQRQLDADRRTWDAMPMTPARAAYEIGRALPDGVCIADESLTSSAAVARYLRLERRQWFRGRGGGIGEGLPTTVGVKLARPDQPVVGLVSDGASMYAPTALWTAAHHGIPVVWIVLNNRIYRILEDNAVRRRAPSRAGMPFVGTDLSEPPIDFVQVAAGFGVRAHRVEDPGELAGVVSAAIAADEPVLIEVVIA